MKKHLILPIVLLVLGCGNTKDVNTDCIESINEDCVCTMEYNPVCGCNGKTYSNACMASCHGITKYTPGACP